MQRIAYGDLVERSDAQERAKGDVSNTSDRSTFRASTNIRQETQTETGQTLVLSLATDQGYLDKCGTRVLV